MNDLDEELSVRRVGRTVGGRWLLESVLGVGGMATVYAARDPSGAIAAIKILHPEMSVRREVRDRFLREGYVANHIGHAGVVRALEHGETGDEVFLAMELLAGETLRARVKRHGRLPVAEVLEYAEQILDVLALAHEKGVVHRDLKPDNLFVGTDGRIKILDFGLARVLEGVPSDQRTRTGVALGTLAYMAPEQALGRRAEIDGRVDIFALGATMFRVLAGRRVHEAESEAELLMAMASRPAPPLASVVPGVSPAVAGVVDLALAFSRDARYPDARTMQNDVRALRRGELPPYASARLSSREEATRAEMPPAMSHRTQPLAAVSSGMPGLSSTLPMPVMSMGVVAAAPGFGPAVSAPPQGPTSVRTAPLSARGAPHGGPVMAAPGPGSFATTMPSTQPPVAAPVFASPQPVVTPPVAKSRGSLAILVLVVLGLLAIAGGAGAWYFVAGPGASGEAATATSAAVPGALSGPGIVGESPQAPAPAAAVPGADTVNAPSQRAPGKKSDAPGAPSASAAPGASAAVAPTPTVAPSASASPAAPVSPSASPATPAPTAPPAPPAPAPTSPSTAAPAPPAPAPASSGDNPRFGPKRKGRGGKG